MMDLFTQDTFENEAELSTIFLCDTPKAQRFYETFLPLSWISDQYFLAFWFPPPNYVLKG